jgi:hypothetical protein
VELLGPVGGCSVMTPTPEFLPIPMIDESWRADPLRLAVAGFLALRIYAWLVLQGRVPEAARRMRSR